LDLKDYYRLVRRNLLLVITFIILGVGAAAGITSTQTPLYQAHIQLFVSTPSSAVDISALAQGSSFTQQRVISYSQVINGPQTLLPVIEKLHLNISEDALSKEITATAPLNTVLINVTVTDKSPTNAANIANEVGLQFSNTVNLLESANSGSAGTSNPPFDSQATNNTQRINVSVVKTALVPTAPSSPKKFINLLLGLILGFGLGIGLAILRQIFDNTVKNEEHLDATPLLSAIGFDKDAAKKPLITQISKWSPRTEAFRQLRTNLQYLKVEHAPKVINVTSALPGEGKTTSAINLALSLSASGYKTLLIEADMRRPKVLSYLQISAKSAGLSDLLSGRLSAKKEYELRSTIHSKEGHNLEILASGAVPPNPAELLDSEMFDFLINTLRESYEYIVIDCPPALPVTDAAIISTRADGTVIVVKAGQTRINQYLGTRESIRVVGGEILGVILNMIPAERGEGDYGYRYSGRYSRKYGDKYGYSTYSGETPADLYAPEGPWKDKKSSK
jgi:non-specific protein-tyrosine kinase